MRVRPPKFNKNKKKVASYQPQPRPLALLY